MGVCSSRQKHKKSVTMTPITQISTKIIGYTQPCSENKQNFKSIVQMPSVVEICEYDPMNPHRQFNVMINGVHFEVINSVEEDIMPQHDLSESQ